MKESVYIETTIVSYLTSRPSRDLILAACQEMTRAWWDECRNTFDLFVSERVVAEAEAGDANAAKNRLEIIREIPVLKLSDDAEKLAGILFKSLQLPKKAVEDAFHIAISITSGMNYLLTWNCKHIANARMLHSVEQIANENGYQCPIICTPQELMENYK